MTTLPITIPRARRLVGLAAITLSLAIFATPADAQDEPELTQVLPECADDLDAAVGEYGYADVVEANGFLDGILVDFMEERIAAVNESGQDQRLLVFQMDSAGAVVEDDEIVQLARVMRDSEVPIAIWVGQPGSKLEGASAQLASAVDILGISNGSEIGKLGEPILPADEFEGFGEATQNMVDDRIDAEDAAFLGLIDEPTPIIGEFLLTQALFDACLTEADNGNPVAIPLTTTRFSKLNLIDQQFHSVASPPVAYLLFLSGMAILIFELFTAGVGVAGVVGAVCFLLGSYGLGVLPSRPWAVAALVLASVAFAVDVQVGVPRFWSAVGSILLVAGSVFLYEGVFTGWIPLITGIAGMLLSMLSGMPAMVRTRFSTPTIGRDWMIGELAEATTDISREGTVRIKGALWPAVVNRATPVVKGDEVRVVAVDRNTLEVEPLEGAARDYRDRGGTDDANDRAPSTEADEPAATD